MLRNVTLSDISDGNLYTANDLVKADTCNCIGCKTVCCQNMGNTIVLDPFDTFCISRANGKTFAEMLDKEFSLNVVDGLILPNLKMDELSGRCSFLDNDNRCKIHTSRPGICRMFPLGRYWEDDTHFKYILQVGECNKSGLSKIKVKKWLGIEDLSDYDSYIVVWHSFICELKKAISSLNDNNIRILSSYVCKVFYLTPYNCSTNADFYKEFSLRIATAKAALAMGD